MNIGKLVGLILGIIFILGFIIVFILPTFLQNPTSSSYEVIDIKMYHDSSSLLSRSSNGYIITYIDNNEIIDIDIYSSQLTIYKTDEPSNIILTTKYRIVYGELYYNLSQHGGCNKWQMT
ncbi:hypothetical protein KA005_36860 [bacterium]|nr:hypothetical protein [bacterium]